MGTLPPGMVCGEYDLELSLLKHFGIKPWEVPHLTRKFVEEAVAMIEGTSAAQQDLSKRQK